MHIKKDKNQLLMLAWMVAGMAVGMAVSWSLRTIRTCLERGAPDELVDAGAASSKPQIVKAHKRDTLANWLEQ